MDHPHQHRHQRMWRYHICIAVVLFGAAFLLPTASSHELCVDGTGPSQRTTVPLPFCGTGINTPYNSKGCCDLTADAAARAKVAGYGLNASSDVNNTCAPLIKQLTCSACDPWSAHLWNSEGAGARSSPWMCRFAVSDFCNSVWFNCANVTFASNPFTGKPGRFSTVYNRPTFVTTFCQSAPPAYCYNGKPYFPTVSGPVGTINPANPVLCLDRIFPSYAIGFVPMPRSRAGVNTRRAVSWTQGGSITLLELPPPRLSSSSPKAPGKALGTWLSLASLVWYDGAERGLLSVAFHPNFASNGRFFVSYMCNRELHPECAAPCQCRLDPVCSRNAQLLVNCTSVTVIAEYAADPAGTGGDYTRSNKSLPTEVGKILKFGRTWDQHNGGQLLFKPKDPNNYLYYFGGDSQPTTDSTSNYAQNPKMFQGKVLRLDIDRIPANKTYGIPPDNPFVGDPANAAPELWALGLRNPWASQFDALTGKLFTGDVGWYVREEVDMIEPGNNYGWRYYEGSRQVKAPGTVYGSLTWPLFEFTHSQMPTPDVSVTGGVVYRSKLSNPCLWGKYLFNNYRALPWWMGTVYPAVNQPYSTEQVQLTCWNHSTYSCPLLTAQGGIYWLTYAEDLDREVYVMGYSGIYRLVDTSFCGKSCPTSTVELARGLSTTLSSTGTGSASLTVDGSFRQLTAGSPPACARSLNSTGPWWAVDLDRTAAVSSIKIWLPTDCCTGWFTPFLIEVSSTLPGVVGRQATACTSSGVNAVDSTVTATCSASGRYVSITLPGPSRVLTVCEVQVYGRAV